MARSVWKGPFVELSLLKKAEAAQEATKRAPIKTWSRRATSLPRGGVRRASPPEEGGSRPGSAQARADQDLVAPFDDPAAVRRPDVQRLQRPQVRAGVGQRGHGRNDARRGRSRPP